MVYCGHEKILLIVLSIFLLSSCKSKPPTIKVIVASDLHLISPKITDFGEYFTKMMAVADGKITRYSNEIADAFVNEVCQQKPDLLILTGDLSFNGALESHQELANKIRKIKDNGTQVLVLPGNHDVYQDSTARFFENSYELIDTSTSDDFKRIYSEFGFNQAISQDNETLSYRYDYQDMTIIMLDTNSEYYAGSFGESTYYWLEAQLQDAKRLNRQIIIAGHQNLFKHSFLEVGYVIYYAQQLVDLFSQYDVNLFLSGHIHIQHSHQEQGITEILTSSLTVSPFQYGKLEIGETIQYKAESLDVDAWAQSVDSQDPNLLNLSEYGRQTMFELSYDRALQRLSDQGVLATKAKEYATVLAQVNQAYFAGDMSEIDDEQISVLKILLDDNLYHPAYVRLLLDEVGSQYQYINIK